MSLVVFWTELQYPQTTTTPLQPRESKLIDLFTKIILFIMKTWHASKA